MDLTVTWLFSPTRRSTSSLGNRAVLLTLLSTHGWALRTLSALQDS